MEPTNTDPTSNNPTDITVLRASGREPQRLTPQYPGVTPWVEQHFIRMFKRTLGGEFRWCAQWWRHAEAISRLTALWYAWEVMRLQGSTGMGIWYRDHLDHQLPILLGARGPFYQCSEQEHIEPHEPIADPVPPGWWIRPPASVPTEKGADGRGAPA
jgi:Domain of unknown function (DUF4913)